MAKTNTNSMGYNNQYNSYSEKNFMWILTEHKEAGMMVIIIRMVIKWNSKELYRLFFSHSLFISKRSGIVGSFGSTDVFFLSFILRGDSIKLRREKMIQLGSYVRICYSLHRLYSEQLGSVGGGQWSCSCFL